jgi:2'-5' RNA ligase
MTPANPLHIMAKPPPPVRQAIARLGWVAPLRPPENLHWTVVPDPGDARWTAAALAAVLDGFEAAPFALVFDRARGRAGASVEVRCRRTSAGARDLVAALRVASERAGIVFQRKVRPHITLDYNWRGADFDVAIEPIVWEIDRLELIESVTGQGRHRARGEWRLVPRQGVLFPLTPCDPARLSGDPARQSGDQAALA